MKALATKTQSSTGPVRKSVRRVVSSMRAESQVQRAEIRNMLRKPMPQAKLPIGPSGDSYEREADAIADRVLRMPESPDLRETNEHEEENGERSVRRDADEASMQAADEGVPVSSIQRTESAEAEEEPEPVEEHVQRQVLAETAADEGLEDHEDNAGSDADVGEGLTSEDTEGIQLKSIGSVDPHVSSPSVAARIVSPDSGRALPTRVRNFMEPRMGYRFAHVRLHDNSRDQADAASLRARAFTYRNYIWFGKGQSTDNRRLMAHELAHVVQQRAAVQRRVLDESVSEVAAAEPENETEKKGFFSGLKKLVGGVVEKAKDLGGAAKRALLEKLAVWVHKIPGFHLLTVILGRNPVTGETVERNAVTLIGAFLRLVPRGEQLFENLQRSGAIERAFAWLNDQIVRLNLTWNTIRVLFQQFYTSLSVTDITNPPGVIERLKRIFGPPLERIRNFVGAVGRKVLEFIFAGVLSLAGGYGEKIMAVIRKAGDVFHLIVSDPIGFLKNLLQAVQQGFTQFMGNIWIHLKAGLLGWLFGALQGAGLKLPEKFDFKGILSIVLQVLGLTYAYLRKKLVKLIGEKRVRFLEQSFEFVKILVTQGLMAAWNKLLEYMGSLWDTVIGAIRDWVVTKIVKGAIAKLVTMFNPVGAIIQAIMTVYNTIAFFIERMNQIMALANAVFDSITNIALGKLTAAANYVENTMARTVPVVIGFLARLLNLGGIAERIKGIIKGIQARVDAAIDKVVGFIVKKAKSLFLKGKAFGAEVGRRVFQWWRARHGFQSTDGQQHSVYIQGSEHRARLMIASDPTPYSKFILDTQVPPEQAGNKSRAARIAGQLDQAINAAVVAPVVASSLGTRGGTPTDHAEVIDGLIGELAEVTALFMPAGINDSPSTQPVYGATNAMGYGTSATVLRLTHNRNFEGSKPKSSLRQYAPYARLNQRRSSSGRSSYYVLGHLLNHNLGGPGDTWRNLTPLSQGANNQRRDGMLHGFEKMVKHAVDADRKQVNFIVTANYIMASRSSEVQEAGNQARQATRDTDKRRWLAVKEVVQEEAFIPRTVSLHAYSLRPDGTRDEQLGREPEVENIPSQDLGLDRYRVNPRDRILDDYNNDV
ncbi:MAG: DUF4157 domain-containing protein [Pseudomonadota bacterium]